MCKEQREENEMTMRENKAKRVRKERGAAEMLEAICLSTNTCVSIRYAGELILLSQHSSALQRKKEGRGSKKR